MLNFKKYSILAILCFTSIAGIAQKAYFVKSGINIGDTSSSISAAIIKATNNKDTIFLMPGTYTTENINLNNLNGRKLFITSLFSRDTTKRNIINNTILDGNSLTNAFLFNSQGNGWNDSVIVIGLRIQNYVQMINSPSGLSYLKIQDCDLNNNGSTNNGFINFTNGITELIHNVFNSNSGNINLSYWSNQNQIQIRRNSFQNHTINSNNMMMGGSGMINIACCGSSKTILENNLFYNSAGSSTGYVININNPSSDSTIIRNNTFFNNDINSIKVEGTSNICLIQNNLFNTNNRNSTTEFAFASGSKIKIRNNVTYLAWNKYSGFGSADTSNSGINYVFQDLKFSNTYYPTSQSPFIGLGSNIGIPSNDLDGGIRPNPIGSSPEIGAFETSFSLVIPKIESIEGTNRKITVNWNNNFGEKVKGVAIYRSTSNNINYTNYLGYVNSQNASSYIDSNNITNGVLYYYSIKTVGSIQPIADSSSFSPTVSVICATSTLQKPNNFTGTSSPSRIKLNWDKIPSTDTIKYNIYRSTDINTAVTILTTQLQVISLYTQ